MIFDMDDFDKSTEELLDDFPSDYPDDVEFINSLLVLTNMLKNSRYDNKFIGGVHMLMTTINMSNLEDHDSEAIFLIAGLTTHLYKILETMGDELREEYFKSFYEAILFPLIEKGSDDIN